MKQTLEQKISGELADMDLRPEALSGVLSEIIKTQTLFSAIWAVLPLDLAIVDGDGRVLAATPRLWRETLGIKQDLPGGFLSAALSNVSLDVQTMAKLDNALSEGLGFAGTLKLRSGKNRLLVSAQPLTKAEPGEGTFLVRLMDEKAAQASDKNYQQEILREYEANLPFAQMGKVAAGVAHELKNSLQLFSGSVQIMQASYPDDPSVQAHLRVINDEVVRSNELLYGFMGMGRQEHNVTAYQLNDLVSEVLPVLQGECRLKRVELNADLDESLPRLKLDRTRIKQVLINCVMNSEQAIIARRESEPRFWGEITIITRWNAANAEVRLSISDNGVGLTEEQQRRFFEPFYTSANGGHGLGTAISEAIIQLHGGRMEVSGAPGNGCCVTLILPQKTRFAADPADVYTEVAKLM
ncbi:MAG TPA: hypothetical protein IAB00_04605 [Candidatus Avidehalobacter gallistercoris]|uniref:histidine kinase n=1 Tax=Candidatus Avidehalobacter gallistercoris TaxID=2840694 RepID=A0A9D1KYP8_9FIRM|nr:hypothetical protein [Candidatus Avidehalobacter gallistercoris]